MAALPDKATAFLEKARLGVRYFRNARSLVASLFLAVISVWVVCYTASELYDITFTDVVPRSTAQMRNEHGSIIAEVRGIVDLAHPAVEELLLGRNTDVGDRHYYYPIIDHDTKTGIYAYSSLAPEEFANRYGHGSVSLRGIWELTPKDLRYRLTFAAVVQANRINPQHPPDYIADHRLALDIARHRWEMAIETASASGFLLLILASIFFQLRCKMTTRTKLGS